MKNKIKNCSYFTKRLRDNNFVVWKIFDEYNIGDSRRWTILVNPGMESVYITCYINDEVLDYQASFSFDDDSTRFKNNMRIKTLSMEVIMTHLFEHGVTADSNLYKKEVNNNEHE